MASVWRSSGSCVAYSGEERRVLYVYIAAPFVSGDSISVVKKNAQNYKSVWKHKIRMRC
jgi:hypothetical protein